MEAPLIQEDGEASYGAPRTWLRAAIEAESSQATRCSSLTAVENDYETKTLEIPYLNNETGWKECIFKM